VPERRDGGLGEQAGRRVWKSGESTRDGGDRVGVANDSAMPSVGPW